MGCGELTSRVRVASLATGGRLRLRRAGLRRGCPSSRPGHGRRVGSGGTRPPGAGREPLRPQVPGAGLPDAAARRDAPRDRRTPGRRCLGAGRVGGRLDPADPDRGRRAVAEDRAQDPLRREARLLRDPGLGRPGEGAPLPGPPRRLHGRHRGRLLRQLQLQAQRVRVRPHRRRQQDRPHPRQRRGGVGHHLGRGLGRQGRPRRAGLDRRVPGAAQPAALRAAAGAGVGAARVALDQPQPRGGAVAADPAPEQRAHAPARRARRDPRPAAAAPPRAAAARRRPRQLGPLDAGWDRGHGLRRPRPEAGADEQLHARRHLQPGLRPGRGRPLGREPLGLRDLLRREATVLPRGPQDPELRPRGRGPALLLAPHRAAAVAAAPARGRRAGESARQHHDPGGAQGHGPQRGRAVGGRAAELHPAGDRRGPLSRRDPRAGGGALHQLHRRPPAQGLGQGQHQPGRHADLDPPLLGRPRTRAAADERARVRDRLHPLPRRPQLRALGERRREPRERRGRGDPRAADEPRALLPAARRGPPGRRAGGDVALGARRRL